MRIDAYNAVNQIYQTSQISKAKTAAKTSSVSDKFEISDTAKTYQTARTAVSKASDVREDKIADIKARMVAPHTSHAIPIGESSLNDNLSSLIHCSICLVLTSHFSDISLISALGLSSI